MTNKWRVLIRSSCFSILLFLLFSWLGKNSFAVFAQNKCGVNVGPYYGQVGQVRNMAKEGGWVVALGTLGDCGGFSSLFGQGVNVVLRAYNAGNAFDAEQALAWTATLGKLDTKGQMVYFMPWNEPNHTNEGGGDNAGPQVAAYLQTLRQHLSEAGLLNTKVTLLSPMVNKTNPNFTSFINGAGGMNAIYGVGSGSSINEYDVAADKNNYVACQHSNNYYNNCRYDQIDIPGPYYALESGVTGIYAAPRYEDHHIAKMLDGSWADWQKDSLKMFAIFSYDPISGGPSWDIFSAARTRAFYSSRCTSGGVVGTNNYDQAKFDSWFEANKSQLVECGACGYAPASAPGWCSGVGQTTPAGFDTSIYNDYNTTDDQFYLHPILGIDRQLPADAGPYNANLKLIRDDLINQGYEAYCATPGFRIELTQAGKDWMADYVEQNPPGAVFGGENNVFIRNPGIGDLVRSWLTVDYREVDTPVFRDIEDKQHLMASLDEYFGFKDTVIRENPQSELTSAAINSLLSNQQRCEASVRILIRQEEMCNKLALPDACALYARPVPETGFTIKTMLDSYKSLAAEAVTRLPDANILGYQDKDTIKAVCAEVLTTDWNLVAREGLLYTPLTIDRAYRLAFLITTIELNNPRYTTMFNLFTHPNGGAVGGPPSPDHAILVNAFKIPDILTTTQLEQESLIASGNTPWTDSSKLTRNSLLTEKMQEEIETTVDEKKIDLIQAANYYDTNSQTHSDEIECMKGASNRGVGGPECKDELAKALVDIINTQTSNRVSPENQIDPTCQELVKEPANEILDYGSFGTVDSITNPPAHLTYTTEFGAQLLNRIFNVPDEDVAETGDLDTTHQIEPRGKSHPSFAETWKPGDPLADNPIAGMPRDWGLKSLFHVVTDTYPDFPYAGCCDEREVKHFLVYPMGYDINTVQEVLASTFFNSEQKDELASLSEDFDRIQITGDEIEFTGGTREYTFADYVKGEPVGYKQNWPPGVDFIGINDPARYAVDEIDRCRKVYGPSSEIEYIDPITFEPVYKPIQIGWELPCDRSFGWNILQKGHELSAGLVGGKLGFYLQNVQKSLNSRYSAVRDYLDTCTTTEQFLTGRCGETVEPVAEANPILCTDASCTQSAPSIPGPTVAAQAGCARGERGREICIRNGLLYIYDHNVDISGDGTADEHCGGHVTVIESNPAGCTLVQRRMWGFSSPGGPLSYNHGCTNLTSVTALFDGTEHCSQEILTVVAN